jgi:hypothetical protein
MVVELVVLLRDPAPQTKQMPDRPEILSKFVFIKQNPTVHECPPFQVGHKPCRIEPIWNGGGPYLGFVTDAASGWRMNSRPVAFAIGDLPSDVFLRPEDQQGTIWVPSACWYAPAPQIFDNRSLTFSTQMVRHQELPAPWRITLQFDFLPLGCKSVSRLRLTVASADIGAMPRGFFSIRREALLPWKLHTVDFALSSAASSAAFAVDRCQARAEWPSSAHSNNIRGSSPYKQLNATHNGFLFDLRDAKLALHEGKRHFDRRRGFASTSKDCLSKP